MLTGWDFFGIGTLLFVLAGAVLLIRFRLALRHKKPPLAEAQWEPHTPIDFALVIWMEELKVGLPGLPPGSVVKVRAEEFARQIRLLAIGLGRNDITIEVDPGAQVLSPTSISAGIELCRAQYQDGGAAVQAWYRQVAVDTGGILLRQSERAIRKSN